MSLMKSKRTLLLAASLALLTSLPAIVGCAKKDGAGGPGDAALIAAGQSVFASNNCARCHAIGGQGGRMGPDLSRVGAEAGHTPQWLVDHVRNPKAHTPSSRMPSFQGKISDQNLLALGAYLASLK
jgi:mono/diheme cytochrome c family protein